MKLKKVLLFLFICTSINTFAEEQKVKLKFYGFVRNDFYFNSRANSQAIDGAFHIYPEPVVPDAANNIKDKNDVPQATLLAIATRLGLDVNGVDVLGARTSAKVEADFAGFGSNHYVLRIRQAYAKLNWEKSELLIGQTWHPLFGNILPSIVSLNTGSPFQPFNRSPQIRFKQNFTKNFSLTGAAIYQMQYTSFGPLGASTSYMKNAVMPNLFLGLENGGKHWTVGAGIDLKMIKPDINNRLTSVSGMAYTQYVAQKWQVKVKAVYGQNLTDHMMLSGYGASKISNEGKIEEYTNFNIISSWLNVTYGHKWRVGMIAGFSQNLGTSQSLASHNNDFIYYGRGVYTDTQSLLDNLFRVAPHVTFNLPKLTFGIEYDFTTASFGKLKSDGKVNNTYSVDNHRIAALAVYNF